MGFHVTFVDVNQTVPFEIQFHTEQSFAVKTETDILYKRMRSLDTPLDEKQRLEEKMVDASAVIDIPTGLNDIEVDGIRPNTPRIKKKTYEKGS